MVAGTPKYSSTRYHDHSLREFFSFEEVVLKGLASDGGLFHPHAVPNVRSEYLEWKDLSFPELAFQVMRRYIDEHEISNQELDSIVDRSYSTFKHPKTVPLVTLDENRNLHLLELFHGPTFAFKDVALQFLGNLFEFFLVRKNQNLEKGHARHHLTVIGATSGDTGSAAIYGLRGKKDVSIFIMFPDGKVSPVQEAQMTTVLDPNVHCLSVQGTFDDCQDYVKALFADPEMNKIHHLAAVNSINWARILAQITYYFYAYFQLLQQQPDVKEVKFVVPTGNFGDILAGYYAKRMGLPVAKLVIATNENDILHRFWQTGSYTKKQKPAAEPHEGVWEDGAQAHEDGVKETYSPAMDILVSSNFERLLWHLTLEHELDLNPHVKVESSVRVAGAKIDGWFQELKQTGSFTVDGEVLDKTREIFGSYRVSNPETLDAIRDCYRGEAISNKGYVLDPHSAIGVAASLREISAAGPAHSVPVVTLATAHPAKFAGAVELALKEEKGFDFGKILPEEFVGLGDKERRVLKVSATEGLAGIRHIITQEVDKEKEVGQNGA
ncbi:threonine synthase [Cladophialophora bantiana CBS 173.52]|uniref:threonine synthase n=1 Tax=Cladophialophora bantiana (strain ATCC 10958 / CBS 173.52 / CDC B-1940 / NIH 8579) TaxID=1442370 RepID=A0A0D2GI93_CLAB1|nr:threonine synthase [Cladophialophora bantiana CBS 173.52]KIW98077.1 threonine synthase [Cladophialophora bantiana CBS 173.52]